MADSVPTVRNADAIQAVATRDERIDRALDDVANGASMRGAASAHGVSYSTVRDKVKAAAGRPS